MNKSALCGALLALATGLASCSRDDAQAPEAATPAQPKAEAPAASKDPHAPLMRAIFGDDYLPAKGYAIEGGAAAEVPVDGLPLILTATTSMVLPSSDTALVVEGSFRRPADEAMPGEVQGAPIHLYLLRRQGGTWHVTRRHENFAEQNRLPTEMRWISLGHGKPGLAVLTNYMGRGYMGTWLALFDPASDKMTDLADDGGSLLIKSTNDGDCEEHCWSAEAKWRIDPGSGNARNAAYDDLVLEIGGEESRRSNGEAEGEAEDAEDATPDQTGPAAAVEKRSLAGTARYVFGNGRYRLHEGTNTVPPL